MTGRPRRPGRRLRPGELVEAARRSAALLRALAPGRRTFSDLVDEICCPVCRRWVKPRDYLPSLHCCYPCAIELSGRRWTR